MGKVDNTIGETLRFALLLARKGSLRITPPDYSRRHAHTLEEIPRSVFDPGAVLPNRRPDSIRTKLLSVPFIRLVAGNLTFLRNPEKSYAQFFVSDEQKLAYIRILKCGSTSVLRSFLPLVHKPFENYPLKASSIDSIAHYLVRHTLSDTSDYVIFSVTRNPLERLVSAYLDVFNPPHSYPEIPFNIFRSCRTFKDVVKLLDRIPDRYRGPHFVSQTRILGLLKGRDVLRFDLDASGQDTRLEHFLNAHGMAMHRENPYGTPYDFRTFYDTETLELAYRIYERDFEMLGYKRAYLDLKESLQSGWSGRLYEPTSTEGPTSS